MRASEFLTELFDPRTAFPLEWDDSFAPTELHANAHDRQGRTINISFVPFHLSDDWQAVDIEFTRGGSHDVTGRGDAERVFATVIEAIKVYLSKYNQPLFILFSGKEQSRFKLYSRMIARFASQFGYQVVPYEQLPHELRDIPGLPRDVFALMRKSQSSVEEEINPEILEPDFHAEKEIDIPDVGRLKMVAKNIKSPPSVPQFLVNVYRQDGQSIGYFRFVVMDYQEPGYKIFSKFAKKSDPYVIGGNVTVWNEYQRRGIARAVYQWIKSMGNDLRPSPTQTDAGKSMWRSFEKEPIGENFKDGKNPGRKGLAKRSGVNCKQSVSKLRKIASTSSGERQRMAHWCANMKSGKKKKS